MSPFKHTARLPSDIAIALHPATSEAWKQFAKDQAKVHDEFRAAMFKLSTLGQNVSTLVDCSELIPHPPLTSPSEDKSTLVAEHILKRAMQLETIRPTTSIPESSTGILPLVTTSTKTSIPTGCGVNGAPASPIFGSTSSA